MVKQATALISKEIQPF